MRNKIISAFLSGTLLVSSNLIPVNASAETTYASAGDFLENVMQIATSNITSETKETAIDNVISNITVTGNEVFYETESIGYWYSEASDTLYKDAEKTEILVESGENGGYIIDSALLSELLTDVNDGIVEKYEPTSTDWSKIIGKYDVALGNTTIPADNWVDFSDKSDDYFINVSRITGVTVQCASTTDTVMAFSWLVDKNGELYISSGIEGVGKSDNNAKVDRITHLFGESQSKDEDFRSASGNIALASFSWITLSATVTTSAIDATFTVWENASLSNKYSGKSDAESFNTLRSVSDPSIAYTETIEDAVSWGVAYCVLDDFSWTNYTSFATEHNNFWTTFEASQTVVGNSTLVKRISKISNLDDSDVLVISPTGWTVNGTDIDVFLNTQENTVAGGATDMGVAVEVESKNFRAVLPTTLPVYVNRDGTVITATNASILNESNDRIEITDLEINAKPSVDWTLVTTTPSQEEGAKEFSFEISLGIGNEIDAGANLPFTYTAAFSPEIYNCETLDAATVTVTLDWAS